MLGFVVNAAGVVIGSFAGLALKKRVPSKLFGAIRNALGLLTMVLGLSMALKGDFLLLAASVLTGTLVGELLRVDLALERGSNWVKGRLKTNESGFSEALITAFLVFCIGPMTIIGSLQDGLEGNPELIYEDGA